MCLGVPGKIVEIKEIVGFKNAICDVAGTTREVSLALLPDAQVGDYILIHAGYGMQIIDEEAANETLDLLQQIEWSE